MASMGELPVADLASLCVGESWFGFLPRLLPPPTDCPDPTPALAAALSGVAGRVPCCAQRRSVRKRRRTAQREDLRGRRAGQGLRTVGRMTRILPMVLGLHECSKAVVDAKPILSSRPTRVETVSWPTRWPEASLDAGCRCCGLTRSTSPRFHHPRSTWHELHYQGETGELFLHALDIATN